MNSAPTDLELRAMLVSADRRESGFRLLMRRYGEAIYWHIRRIVVGHDDAEDVFQETCVQVFRHIQSYKGEGKLSTWMYRIATNEALRHLRRRTHRLQSLDSVNPALLRQLQAETPFDADTAQMRFQEALLQLPTQQRLVFNMRYYDDLSYEEMASITGKTIGNLKTLYHYAVKRLRLQLTTDN
ncbi:MAG: sigma-70 family RNA polymerase sigma factor [Bacteroidaceae bacterium]|nr:sigma-70 family RNA polymerase sigma factor [Bacteroidaceae bacterium]